MSDKENKDEWVFGPAWDDKLDQKHMRYSPATVMKVLLKDLERIDSRMFMLEERIKKLEGML